MKTVLMLMVVGLAAVVLADQKYSSKYDNVDVEPILSNPRVLENYVKCVLDRAPCPPEGKLLKDYLPDAVQTRCEKCTDKQRELSEKVIRALINSHPNLWKQLTDKYDPTGTFKAQYEEEARAHNIKLP